MILRKFLLPIFSLFFVHTLYAQSVAPYYKKDALNVAKSREQNKRVELINDSIQSVNEKYDMIEEKAKAYKKSQVKKVKKNAKNKKVVLPPPQ